MKSFWRHYRRNHLAVAGLAIVGITLVIAILAPLSPFGPTQISDARLEAPSLAHWAGTDSLGRDVFTQLLYGSRIALLVGVLAAVIAIVIGTALGSIAGYFGGRVDAIISRVTELFQVMPSLIVALVLVALFGGGIDRIILVIGVLSWVESARIVRAQFLSLRKQEFVEAARSINLPTIRIILSEVLPNALPPLIVMSSVVVAQAILLEAGLSFLGLGDPNVISWGSMLNEAQRYLSQAVWLAVFPGLAIFLLVFAFNVIGDGVNEAQNPRLRES